MIGRILPQLRSSTIRAYSTAPSSAAAKGSSNTPLYFLTAGLVGAGAYYYSTTQDKAKSVHSGVQPATLPSALNPDEWKTFKLDKVEPYNHNTAKFIFKLPEGTAAATPVASALLVKAVNKEDCQDDKQKPVLRPYTQISPPDAEGYIELLVKKYPEGKMTNHIHNLKPGQELAFKGPLPKFAYKPNQFEHVVLISGGSGITPMYQVAQAIFSNPQDKTKVTLVYGNIAEEDILLRKEWESLAKKFPERMKNVFVLDKAGKEWQGPTGYIDQKLLAQNAPAPAFGERVKIFVCGPPGMMNAISGNKVSPKDQGELKGLLADLGYTENQASA
ncbi:hypothetical protein OIV83_003286 [Microbotryomycetes sp. JL201]|nr:hypothetical protein OIV83_003286 [Microbotryomycetes sp. JL201]